MDEFTEIKDLIYHLDKTFDHRIRLGIMLVLLQGEEIDFNTLKQILDVTDGNLASHIKTLQREKIIEVHKQMVGRRFTTSYSITPQGKDIFAKHLGVLHKIMTNFSDL